MLRVIKEMCIGCGACIANCPAEAITWDGDVAFIDNNKCEKCGTCRQICPVDAISKID
ncbi:MAG: 4Fe-4S binding protein [Candidatus Theseobacter exili]|nr:4Fe-4S binding protein [Candidatus Theseobacter exili]